MLRLIAPFLTLTLLFFLGRLVSGHRLASATGDSGGYFPYAVLGSALMTVLGPGIYAYSEKIREEQTSGTIEALLATPTRPWVLVLSSGVFELLRSIAEAFLLLAVGAVFFGLRLHLSATALVGAILGLGFGLLLACALGVFFSGLTIVLKKAGPVVGLAGGALPLLAGVFYPVSLLPAPLRQLAEALPFTWDINLTRDALLHGTLSVGFIGLLLAASAVAVPLALAAFGEALRHAQRSGTLGHY